MQIVKELLVNKASFPQFCQKTACSERDQDTTLPISTHTPPKPYHPSSISGIPHILNVNKYNQKYTAFKEQMYLPMICNSRKCRSEIDKNCMTGKKKGRVNQTNEQSNSLTCSIKFLKQAYVRFPEMFQAAAILDQNCRDQKSKTSTYPKKKTSKTSQILISITSQSIDASMASRLVHKSALYMLSCKLEK